MSETVTLQLSTELVSRARILAAATNRGFEEIVAEWIGRGAVEPALEGMADQEILEICHRSLPSSTQQELSDLLARNHESSLGASERRRLDELMAAYRQGLVLKAKAWQQAVARGLKPPLSDNAA